MSNMPREPEAFAQHVADMLRDIKPECQVELTGPGELLVNGRRLDLQNVFRMVLTEPDRGSEIIRHYLGQLFAPEAESVSSMDLDFARPRIMPRIQPVSIFDHLDEQMVAHVPFVNDTVVVFVTDLPQMTVSITTEQLLRWNVEVEEVEEFALENLSNYTPELEIQFVESKEGGGPRSSASRTATTPPGCCCPASTAAWPRSSTATSSLPRRPATCSSRSPTPPTSSCSGSPSASSRTSNASPTPSARTSST